MSRLSPKMELSYRSSERGCKDDTVLAIENGAEGVGLYRIEQAYLGRQEPPDTAALLEEMRRVPELAKGLPVCVRLWMSGRTSRFLSWNR